MKIVRFEDLEIWKEARELCRIVYSVTSVGPFSNDFRFRDQIRASAGSRHIVKQQSRDLRIGTDGKLFIFFLLHCRFFNSYFFVTKKVPKKSFSGRGSPDTLRCRDRAARPAKSPSRSSGYLVPPGLRCPELRPDV